MRENVFRDKGYRQVEQVAGNRNNRIRLNKPPPAGSSAEKKALVRTGDSAGDHSLMAEELVFFCVNSGPEAHHVYPNGDEVSNFEIVYLCRNYHGEPKNTDGEMEELRFFAPEEIDLEMISPPIRPVLRRYIEQLA